MNRAGLTRLATARRRRPLRYIRSPGECEFPGSRAPLCTATSVNEVSVSEPSSPAAVIRTKKTRRAVRPRGTKWSDPTVRKAFIDMLASKIGVHKPEDWYQIKAEVLAQNGAGGLLRRYGNSFRRLLVDMYPGHRWDVWKFHATPLGWFNSPENGRIFFQRWLEDNGYSKTDLNQLYTLTFAVVRKYGGGALLKRYRTLHAAVRACFPEHSWDNSRFERVPMKMWQSSAERRKMFEQMRIEIFGASSTVASLAALTFADASSHGAGSLLATYYGGNLRRALEDLYPEHSWDEAAFRVHRPATMGSVRGGRSLKRGLATLESQRKFFDWICKTYGGGQLSSFYDKITLGDLERVGAGGLIRSTYGGSLFAALQAIYPEHLWEIHNFPNLSVANHAIAASAVQAPILERLQSRLGITVPEDWYCVSFKDLMREWVDLGAEQEGLAVSVSPAAPAQSISAVAKACYPEYPWRPWLFSIVERSFWMDPANVRMFLDSFAADHQIDTSSSEGMSSWYKVKQSQIKEFGGNGVLAAFDNSLRKLLSAGYPHHPWKLWMFRYGHSEGWDSKTVTTAFFDEIRGTKPLDSLYDLTLTQIRAVPGGRKLLSLFHGSMHAALEAAYPAHVWDFRRSKVS